MKNSRSMPFLLIMLISVVMLAACGAKENSQAAAGESNNETKQTEEQTNATDSLVVYAALNEEDMVEIEKKFEADTGIDMEYLRIGNAGETSTRVLAEKENPQADIMVGGSVEFYEPLAQEGILEKYISPNAADMDDKFNDPNGYWQGWYMGVLGIVVNKDRFNEELATKGVEMPKTWDDLLDPNYEGVFLSSNPATAGGGYIFAATQLFRLGEEKGWEYLKGLNKNVHHYTAGAVDPINLVATGEFVAGMSWAHDIVKSAKQGYPIEVIVPEHTAFEIGGAAIIKGGKNTENAKIFMDWLLTKEVGEMNTAVSNRYSVRSDVEPPQGMIPVDAVTLVDYDRSKAAEMKEDVVNQFNEMIGQ